MSTRRKLEAIDPTLPFTPIDIDGKTYKMCFDMRALIVGERELNKGRELGQRISIAPAFRELNLENLCVLFAASLQRFHPEIGFEEALSLVTMPVVSSVQNAVMDAWVASLPKTDESEDVTPGPQ